ncbi:MAG: ribonuclease III [Actinobacteria bacterium]|nr:ribonuclease III [Actinomycetota bacterium]
MRLEDRERFEQLLGYSFRDEQVMLCALSHRSWCAEHPQDASNERLEFLGDAVLGVVVTDHLYRRYPDLAEGELAKARASVVNADALAEIGAAVGLGPCLRLGKGEDASGGRTKTSILADATEAVFAAVYLEGGIDAARDTIMRLLEYRITDAASGPGGDDYKTRLQELAARRFDRLPRYQVRDEGPDHAKRFFATVLVGGEARGAGEGGSKKQAEQAAARSAWLGLRAETETGPESTVGADEAAAEAMGGDDAGAA